MIKPPAEDAEIEPQSPIVSVEIPDTPATPQTHQKRRMGRIVLWNMGTRSEYFDRHSLTEEDIFVDEHGKEYWVKETETEDGEPEVEIVYVPTRYKNKSVKHH